MGDQKDKGTSSVNPKEKSSLLEFDIGDDFLSSWKPKSGGEADVMDLDFGSLSKNKKKTFDFDKMDIDFKLDGDFGKLSSFNIELSDLDVSPPLKKDAKQNEKPRDASGKGNKGKADKFDFSFDFDELDRFTFKSSLKKDEICVEDRDKDGSPIIEDPGGATFHLTEEISELEDNLRKKPTSGDLSSSYANLQHGSRYTESTDEGVTHKSIRKDNLTSKTGTAEKVAGASGVLGLSNANFYKGGRDPDSTDESLTWKSEGNDAGTLESLTLKKDATALGVLNSSKINLFHDGRDPDSKIKDITLNLLRNDFGTLKMTAKKAALQKEEISLQPLIPTTIQQPDSGPDKGISAGPLIEEAGFSDPLPELSVHSSSGEDSSEHTTELQEEHSHMATNMVIIGREQDVNINVIADSGSGNGERELENLSPQHNTISAKWILPEGHVGNNEEVLECVRGDFHTNHPSNICEPSQMLLINQANGDPIAELLAPSSSRATIDSPVPAGETPIIRSKYFAGSSKTASESQKASSSEPKLVLTGSKTIQTTQASLAVERRFQANPASLAQEAERITTTTSANTKPLLPNLVRLLKKTSPESEKVSINRPVRKVSDLTSIKHSRSLEALNSSVIEKKSESTGSLESNEILHGEMPSTVNQLADPGRQTLLSVSLKRKTPDAPGTMEMMLGRSKRLSESRIESSVETSTSVDKEEDENLANHNGKGAPNNYHLSPVKVLPEFNMQNLGMLSTMNDESNIEKAEACSTELEAICNMLRKKHEEAKDILVRAITNNNKLLMLNHPLYDEKICMIQKFSAGLTLGK